MSKSKPEDISRRSFIGVSAAVVAGIAAGCGSNSGNGTPAGVGGGAGTGGASAATGGADTGGAAATTGGAGTGGASAGTGGAGTGGASAATGGAGTGGASAATGGAATGGAAAGGAATGGAGTGGAATGGKSSNIGGAATGGTKAGTGGAGTGGAGTGGTSSTNTPAVVSLVRGTDWVQATIDAIALAGGLPDLTGKTVMLRPNVISASPDATTNKDVIRGVIKAAKAKGATTIIVGEDGWEVAGNTIGAMTTLGIADVCAAEGATTMDLSKQTYTTRSNANATAYPNGVAFSDPVYNADFVIAIPKCKTHSMAKFTMALKLWYGNVHSGDRAHGNTWAAPAELHLIRKADFTVLDATSTMTTGGPSAGGTMVQSKIVVASKDAIAADVTGLFIEKYSGSTVISTAADAWNMNQIKRALALKFPGWVGASQQFSYAQQGVAEAAQIMGY